jgi:hypothetical protein
VDIGNGFNGTINKTGIQTIVVQVANVSPEGNVFISSVLGQTYCEDVSGGANVVFETDITGGVTISCGDGACI